MAIMLVCAGGPLYLGWDLVQLNLSAGKPVFSGGITTTLVVLSIISLGFLGLTWLMWHAPWIRAEIEISDHAVVLRSDGRIAYPDTRIPFEHLTRIDYAGGHYSNDVLTFHFEDANGAQTRGLATLAVGSPAQTLLQTLDAHMRDSGWRLDGKPLDSVLLIYASWTVRRV